jgi:hypothetical protein
MSYLTQWLSKTEMGMIERIEDLPAGTLTPDEGPDGKLEGGYASNLIRRVHPALRNRAEFAIQQFVASRQKETRQ